jgi:hypothetical protein
LICEGDHFRGLAKVAIFNTNFDSENQTLINHKCVCGALNRHFIQTRVIPSLFFSVVKLSISGTVGQAYSFVSFGLRVGLCGLQMCMTAKGWHSFVCLY